MNTNEALKLSIELEALKKENRELKAQVKLTDFTSQQLTLMINLVCKEQAEAQYIIDKHLEYGLTDGAPMHQQVVDDCQLWATQLIAAKAKVITQDIVNAN